MARNMDGGNDAVMTLAEEHTPVNESNAPAPTDTSTETSSEQPTETATTEAASTDTSAEEQAAAKAAEEKKAAEEAANAAAFEEFKSAAELAARDDGTNGRDVATGTLSDKQMAQLRDLYLKMSGVKYRKLVKEYLDDLLRRGFSEDSAVARSALYIKDNLATVKPPSASVTRKPADPTRAFLDMAVPLYLAPAMLTPGEGVAADWQDKLVAEGTNLQDQVAVYVEYQAAWQEWDSKRTDETPEDSAPAEPDVSDLVKAAWQLAHGKTRTRRASTGPKADKGDRPERDPNAKRGDIKAHIANAIKGKPSGTFMTINEIRLVPSEDYPTHNPPSSGAIDAALWPKSGNPTKVQGVRPGNNAAGRKGLYVL